MLTRLLNKLYSIISKPWETTVEFGDEKTKIFNELNRDMRILKIWCSQILKVEFPKYELDIVSLEILKGI